MDEKLKDLWSKNKILFFLLLPLIGLYFFRDAVYALMLQSARRLSNKTKTEDEKLRDEAHDLNSQANRLKSEADALGNAKEGSVREDWHER